MESQFPSKPYDFLCPPRIVFGWGRRREVGALARTLGRRALIICGLRPAVAEGVLAEISAALQSEGIASVSLATILHEPEVADVDDIAANLRRAVEEDDFLLAFGGGAAMDLAKATAAMATNTESTSSPPAPLPTNLRSVPGQGSSVKDYLEGVGRGLKLSRPPLPILAMPSTAGTGAEATKNAVISCYSPPFKKSLRDDRLMPRIALVDPELTVTCPPSVTAQSGMDAITQLIESYVSRKWQPIPRALAWQGLKMAVPAIVEAMDNPASRPAREAMSHAALLSGMALANSGLGMAHGVAAALGTHCRVTHGAACALMLPAAIRVNIELCQAEFARLGHLLFGHNMKPPASAAAVFLEDIEKLCDRVGVPRRLGEVGVAREHIPAIVKDARGSSMSGNPRELSDTELTEILEGLL